MMSLAQTLAHAHQPYRAYAYSYPHKTAYRPLEPTVPLSRAWSSDDMSALFLYVHVPFCEMRCGFCNLFTVARPEQSLDNRFLDALERQANVVRQALENAGETSPSFARLAIGGGTPTFLSVEGLQRAFAIVEEIMGAQPRHIPVSCEMSPETITEPKLSLLKARGVDRASIGIQSFLESETRALGRPQRPEVAQAALSLMRDAGFPIMNIDLIYGIEGQTEATFLESLQRAVEFEPEELYLYPLYVRPLTGLGRRKRSARDEAGHRLRLYRTGRDWLLKRGYTQRSMRLFRAPHAPHIDGPPYRCQEDGMVGLGPGARSYTRALHYCTEYAVSRRGVLGILMDYLERSAASFAAADYGVHLSPEEQRRRYLIQSILHADGLQFSDYQARFATSAEDDFPQLSELTEHRLASWSPDGTGLLRLNEAGLELSDLIGPWLFSQEVQQRMEAFDLR